MTLINSLNRFMAFNIESRVSGVYYGINRRLKFYENESLIKEDSREFNLISVEVFKSDGSVEDETISYSADVGSRIAFSQKETNYATKIGFVSGNLISTTRTFVISEIGSHVERVVFTYENSSGIESESFEAVCHIRHTALVDNDTDGSATGVKALSGFVEIGENIKITVEFPEQSTDGRLITNFFGPFELTKTLIKEGIINE